MRRADVVVAIDGQSVTSAEQLQRIVESSGVGKVLQVKAHRGKRVTTLSIRTAELEDAS